MFKMQLISSLTKFVPSSVLCIHDNCLVCGYTDCLPQQSHQFIYHVHSNSQNLTKPYFLTLSKLRKARLSVIVYAAIIPYLDTCKGFLIFFLNTSFPYFLQNNVSKIWIWYINFISQYLVHTSGSINIY